MAISKRLRFEILKRDGNACRYCGAMAPEVKLTIDHVVPVALGGTDEPTNLVAACKDCNAGKSSSSADDQLVADIEADALRWANAMKEAAAKLAEERIEIQREVDTYIGAFHEAWGNYRYLSDDKERGIIRLFNSGLPLEDMVEIARYASTSRGLYDRYAFFMSRGLKRVAEIQALATQILAEEGNE